MTTYTVPESPTDPEAAALELIVRLPADMLHTTAFTTVLQDYCGVLHAEGAFTGLAWADARQIAAAVSFDIVTRDDAADFIRNRARNVLSGADGMERLTEAAGIDARDAVWQHPDLLPEAADLDEPAGFIDRVIGGDTSGIDEAIAEAIGDERSREEQTSADERLREEQTGEDPEDDGKD